MTNQIIRQVVQMQEDYTTESQNLGKRTYNKRGCYQVCPVMFSELMASGKAVALDPEQAPFLSTPISREQIAIVPKVTRWFSANGLDTHHLTKGEKKKVPSNLAAFLISNGLAEAE